MKLQESQLQWVMSAYALSSVSFSVPSYQFVIFIGLISESALQGCLLLLCGRIADLYGRKKTFLIGSLIVAAFTTGSAFAKGIQRSPFSVKVVFQHACTDVMTLDILRGFQGVGAAAQIPASV
jgi:MFS family permease